MRITLIVLFLASPVVPILSQGLVSFVNGPRMLISVGAAGQSALIAGPQGSYYFGLLTAPLGTTDPAQFGFTGIYATNLSNAPGRLYGGVNAAVPGWMPGVTESFLVAGWSASLGHDWNAEWQRGVFDGAGYFGVSSRGYGAPGGLGLPPTPALEIFGGITGIQTGFDLLPVPEPSALSLGIAGGALLLTRFYLSPKSVRRSQKQETEIE